MEEHMDSDAEMQARVARLVGLKRHERPPESHYLGLSRAIRFRLEQEQAEVRSGLSSAARPEGEPSPWEAFTRGAAYWLRPQTWLPTMLAVFAILAWVLDDHGTRSIGPWARPQSAGFGNIPAPLLGSDRPKVAPIVGVHLRIIFLDSDQLPPGFVAFPPLPKDVPVPAQ